MSWLVRELSLGAEGTARSLLCKLRHSKIEPVPSRQSRVRQLVEGKDNGRNLEDFLVSAEKRAL